MFLTMLGYRSDIEGFTGANWALNVHLKANSIDLFDGLSINPDEGLTRDDTAQMLYNGIQSWMVEYRNLEGNYDGVVYPQPLNGTKANSTVLLEKFKVAKVEGVVVASDIMAIDGNGTTVAGKARLCDVYVAGTHRVDSNGDLIDDVYPVALDNSYLGQRVVLYVKGLNNLAPNAASTQVVGQPIVSLDNTVATTSKRLKDVAAVKSFLSDSGLTINDDGANTAVNGTVTYTEKETVIDNTIPTRAFAVTTDSNVNGTEFTFIDHNGDGVVDYIFKLLPRIAKVTVYNEADKTLTIAGEGAIDFDDIANEADVAKDDIVLYYQMNETFYLSKAETVTGKVESYNDNNKTVSIDGTSYGKSTVTAELSSTDLTIFNAGIDMVGNTYTFYLDNSGNVAAWVLDEGTLGNYALVLACEGSEDVATDVIRKGVVTLLMSDGSEGTFNVNLLASANLFGRTGNTSAKENWMSNELYDQTLVNTLVTYTVGEDGKVTIGNPSVVNTSTSVATATATDRVERATSSYTLGFTTVKVNDSTLFFVRNETVGTSIQYEDEDIYHCGRWRVQHARQPHGEGRPRGDGYPQLRHC